MSPDATCVVTEVACSHAEVTELLCGWGPFSAHLLLIAKYTCSTTLRVCNTGVTLGLILRCVVPLQVTLLRQEEEESCNLKENPVSRTMRLSLAERMKIVSIMATSGGGKSTFFFLLFFNNIMADDKQPLKYLQRMIVHNLLRRYAFLVLLFLSETLLKVRLLLSLRLLIRESRQSATDNGAWRTV